MLIGHCEEAVDGVVGELTTFPGLAVQGRTLNYVGMTMDMTEPKVCKITMAGFVTELMAECTDISGTADTPSTATLFEISPTAALLGERDSKVPLTGGQAPLPRQAQSTGHTDHSSLPVHQSAEGDRGGLEEASEACALPAWHGATGHQARPTTQPW
jgi:hypothetical protein